MDTNNKEEIEKFYAKNKEVMAEIEAVFKKHGIEAFCSLIYPEHGITVEYDTGLSLTQKLGSLELARLNADIGHRVNMARNMANLNAQPKPSPILRAEPGGLG